MEKSEFPTQLGVCYTFKRPISEPRFDPKNSNLPVYVNGQMKLFDKDFNLVTDNVKNGDSQENAVLNYGPFSFQNYIANNTFPDFDELKFPDYHEYKSKRDYIIALKQWKNKVLRFTADLILPTPMISKHFVTSPPLFLQRNSPEYRRYNPIKDKLTPKNIIVLHKKLFEDKPDLEEPFPQQLPRRDTVLPKHQMSNELQWQSQLTIREPFHYLYSTFQDYENAYQNWYSLCYNDISIPPIDPHQFSNILGVKKQQLHKYEQYVPPPKVKPKTPNVKISNQYDWTKNIPKAKCEFSLDKLRINDVAQLQIFPDFTIVFGVEKAEFLNDIRLYGVHQKLFRVNSSLFPFKTLYYEVHPKYDTAMEEFIQNLPENPTFEQVIAFLHISYTPAKFQKFLSMKCGKGTFKTIIDSVIPPDKINCLFEIAENSPQHAYRVALLLPYLTYPNGLSLFKYLTKRNHIQEFYKFTKLALLLSTEYWRIYPPPDFDEYAQNPDNLYDSKLLLRITHLHYATLLLPLPVCQFCMPFEIELLNLCRKLTTKIYHTLRRPDIVEELWNSIKINKAPEKPLPMFYLNTIHSYILQQSIAKGRIVKRIAEMSKYEVGRKFLFNILFSSGGISAEPIIRRTNYTSNLILSLDSTSSNILSLFIDQYSIYLKKMHCFAPLQDLNSILIASLADYSHFLLPVVLSCINVLCDDAFISQSDKTFYEGLIANFCGQVCIQTTIDNTIQLNDAMRMLLPAMKYKICCQQIAQNEVFCERLITVMNSRSAKDVQLAWRLFRFLTKDLLIIKKMFDKQKPSKPLQTIATSENPVIFKEFSNFLTRLAKHEDKTLIDIIEQQITNSIGRMACTYKNSPILFHDFPQTLQATEKMCKSILQTNSNFKNSLSNHLSSLGVDWKKIAESKTPPKK